MKTFWQVEFRDLRGGIVRYNWKFATRPDAERFMASQRKPNMSAVEIVPDDPRPDPEPEPIDRDPADEAQSIEGDDSKDALHAKAELTRARKIAALQKARAAKAAKRAPMVPVDHSAA